MVGIRKFASRCSWSNITLFWYSSNTNFPETKLLKLLVTSPDRLLERDFIIQQVWADEGVLVGRSVDVFVSRLRKKLSADVSIGIVAVHGVGYRLETGK